MPRRRLIIRVFLVLLLILVAVVFSVQWWSASLANSVVQYLVSRSDYADTQVRVEELGWGGSQIALESFHADGFSVRDARIEVNYSLEHLRKQRISELIVDHPQVEIDLAKMRDTESSQAGPPLTSDVPTPTDATPASLQIPIYELKLQDAQIAFVDGDWRQELGVNARASLGERSQLTLNAVSGSESLSVKAAGSPDKGDWEARLQLVMKTLTPWLELARRLGMETPEIANLISFEEAWTLATAQLKNQQLSHWAANLKLSRLRLNAETPIDVGRAEVSVRGVGQQPLELRAYGEKIAATHPMATVAMDNFVLQSDGGNRLVATMQDWSVTAKMMGASAGSGKVVATLDGPWSVMQEFNPASWSGAIEVGPDPLMVRSPLVNVSGELWMQANLGDGAESRAGSLALRMKSPNLLMPIGKLRADEFALEMAAEVQDSEVALQDVMAEAAKIKLTYSGINFALQSFLLNDVTSNELHLKTGEWEASGKPPINELGEVSISGGPLLLKLLGPWTKLANGLQVNEWTLALEAERAPFAFYSALGSITGDVSLSGRGDAAEQRIVSSIKLLDGELNAAGATLKTPTLDLLVQRDIGGEMTAGMLLDNASATWNNDAGRLEGLSGWVYPVNLTPPSVDVPQSLTFEKFTQGKLAVEGGEITVTRYAPVALGETPRVDAKISANALGGGLLITFNGTVAPRKLNVRANMDSVELEALSALLPKFEGKISGKVSGQLGVQFIGDNKALIPGVLEMTAGTTGRFQFTKQGWLTQDPKLNPEEFVKGKDIVKLMQTPNAASIITELAMRDLKMTKFRLEIFKPGAPLPAEILIEGTGQIKGVDIPVVLTIPIRGELLETLNLALNFQSKL